MAQEHLFGSLRLEDDLAILTLVGEIDLATISRFEALLEAALAGEPRLVVLDLADVEFLGLCALPALESASRRVWHSGRHLVIRNVAPAVCRMLAASPVGDMVEIETEANPSAAADDVAVPERTMKEQRVLDAALQLVVAMASSTVAGADGASLTLPRQGRLGTAAASDDVVLHMDHDQYATGEGPCLDAATHAQQYRSNSLAQEKRWPAFVPRARARGIEAILSTPMLTEGRAIGALNIYSRTRGVFGLAELARADQLAEHAATVVATADLDREDRHAHRSEQKR